MDTWICISFFWVIINVTLSICGSDFPALAFSSSRLAPVSLWHSTPIMLHLCRLKTFWFSDTIRCFNVNISVSVLELAISPRAVVPVSENGNRNQVWVQVLVFSGLSLLLGPFSWQNKEINRVYCNNPCMHNCNATMHPSISVLR